MGAREATNSRAAQWVAGHPGGRAGTFADAAKHGEILFNCTKGEASLDVLKTAGPQNLANKVLVDVSNALDYSRGMPPHLFVVDLETRKVTDLLPGSRRLFGLQAGEATYDVSPDGSRLVASFGEIDGKEGYFDTTRQKMILRLSESQTPLRLPNVVFDPGLRPGIWFKDTNNFAPRVGVARRRGHVLRTPVRRLALPHRRPGLHSPDRVARWRPRAPTAPRESRMGGATAPSRPRLRPGRLALCGARVQLATKPS